MQQSPACRRPPTFIRADALLLPSQALFSPPEQGYVVFLATLEAQAPALNMAKLNSMLQSIKLLDARLDRTEETVDAALTVHAMAEAMSLGHQSGVLGPYYGLYNHTSEAQRERAQGDGPHNPTVLSRPCPSHPDPLATLSAHPLHLHLRPPRTRPVRSHLCAGVPYLRRHRGAGSRRKEDR